MATTGSWWTVLACVLVVGCSRSPTRAPVPPEEWWCYGADPASTKHSTLQQVTRENFADLEVAWRWTSVDEKPLATDPSLWTMTFEVTPLMARGQLFATTSLGQAAALDPVTGETLWVFDPKAHEGEPPGNVGWVHRGPSYWEDGDDRRIVYGDLGGRLHVLDAATGEPIPSFGDGGRIDLTQGLGRAFDRKYYSVPSPPAVCNDVIVVGSSIHDSPLEEVMPPGDVRAFDVRSGELLWTFHPVPREGDPATATWEDDSWKTAGQANVWTWMSCDEELGLVYLPTSAPTNDFHGTSRPGDNLYAESIVALDLATGVRRWHFQTVHHGLWDYDLPCAPNLADVVIDGQPRKILAQVSKQAFTYVLDRETGEPIWPIVERAVPRSTVPGEPASITQPFPTRPAPFDRQGVGQDDLIDFTPRLRRDALRILRDLDHGPLYTPPSERGAVVVPGWVGGASWAGAAFDPVRKTLFVPSVTLPVVIRLEQLDAPPGRYVYPTRPGPYGPKGLPIVKPPWGRLTAIDLETGEHRWMTAVGDGPRDHPELEGVDLPPLGWSRRAFVLSTPDLLLVGQMGEMNKRDAPPGVISDQFRHESDDPALLAFDPDTGEKLGEVPLPGNATGSPMTYSIGGKQHVVVAIGGAGHPAELVALTLP
ncbi:MAG: pyrroloquinoline quinone-dependent dehydrogenase [Acidobacteriota bacterium]